MSGLDGQAALVTGASSGLGRATATALARAGAPVALLARTASDLEQAAEALSGDGHRAVAVACDLADADGLERAVARVERELGPVRVLVNAAATDVPGSVTQLTAADWDRVMAVNLRAVFLLCRLVLPSMIDAGQGTIVNVSSVAGRRGWADASAYCASKFALTGFTQALHAETREHCVRDCLIYPGAMSTHWGTFQPDDSNDRDAEPADPEHALPPEAVADFIAWLAAAPADLVVNEATVTPLREQGWP